MSCYDYVINIHGCCATRRMSSFPSLKSGRLRVCIAIGWWSGIENKWHASYSWHLLINEWHNNLSLLPVILFTLMLHYTYTVIRHLVGLSIGYAKLLVVDMAFVLQVRAFPILNYYCTPPSFIFIDFLIILLDMIWQIFTSYKFQYFKYIKDLWRVLFYWFYWFYFILWLRSCYLFSCFIDNQLFS